MDSPNRVPHARRGLAREGQPDTRTETALRSDDDADADALRAVAEHEPVAAEEAGRRFPREDPARPVPGRADRQVAVLAAVDELRRRLEAARQTHLDALALLDFDRAAARLTRREDLRQLPM